MYTKGHDLIGFVLLLRDGVEVAKVFQRNKSIQEDEKEADRLVNVLNGIQ